MAMRGSGKSPGLVAFEGICEGFSLMNRTYYFVKYGYIEVERYYEKKVDISNSIVYNDVN